MNHTRPTLYLRTVMTPVYIDYYSSLSPQNSAIVRLTRFGQSSIGSSLLELSTGMQTVREFPNTRKRQAIKRNIYFHTFQRKIRQPGQPEAPKRDVTVEIVIK